jgi:hypothetical protein
MHPNTMVTASVNDTSKGMTLFMGLRLLIFFPVLRMHRLRGPGISKKLLKAIGKA